MLIRDLQSTMPIDERHGPGFVWCARCRPDSSVLRRQLTVANGDDPIDVTGERRIVADDDMGDAELRRGGTEHGMDVYCCRRIELAGRFVRQQESRTSGERNSDGDPLLLATRELVRSMPSPIGHADEIEEFERSGGPRRIASVPPEPHRCHDVLLCGQVGDEISVRFLPDESDFVPAESIEVASCHLGEVVAIEQNPTSRGLEESTNGGEESGLAAPAGSDDTDHLGLLDRQFEALECDDFGGVDAVDLD